MVRKNHFGGLGAIAGNGCRKSAQENRCPTGHQAQRPHRGSYVSTLRLHAPSIPQLLNKILAIGVERPQGRASPSTNGIDGRCQSFCTRRIRDSRNIDLGRVNGYPTFCPGFAEI